MCPQQASWCVMSGSWCGATSLVQPGVGWSDVPSCLSWRRWHRGHRTSLTHPSAGPICIAPATSAAALAEEVLAAWMTSLSAKAATSGHQSPWAPWTWAQCAGCHAWNIRSPPQTDHAHSWHKVWHQAIQNDLHSLIQMLRVVVKLVTARVNPGICPC